MEFVVNYDDKKFVASQKNVDEYIDDINFSIRHSSDSSAHNFQIISDSKDMIEYIVEKLKKDNPQYESCDLSQNKTNSVLRIFEKAKTTPLIIYGIEEYLSYINNAFYNGKICEICGRTYKEAQRRFYTAVELGRDSLFSEFKTRVIFLMSDSEYNAFLNLADDFASYYPEYFDFNQILTIGGEGYTNLFEYLNYYKKGLKVIKKKSYSELDKNS